MRRSFVFLLLTFLVSVSSSAAEYTLFQKPTLSRDKIVFGYAGDLWIVAREGGDADRLTYGTGTESGPHFSPDGSAIAFTGEYDGNVDVYIVPATGGQPKRLTFHPSADSVVGWAPDGKSVLFRSSRESHSGFSQLYSVGIAGGFPTLVPLPTAFEGSFSPDGKRIAYQPISQWQPGWKRYRGGQTTKIWIAALADSSVQAVPRENSNDSNPMWVGDEIFFLSDREGPATIFSYNAGTKKVTRVIPAEDLDIKAATAGPGAIVYERFGSIYLLDLQSRRSRPVSIRVNGDMLAVRARFERVGTRATNASLSPTGARAVFEARGEIVTVPAEKGDPRNLTNTPAVMERDPSWSPDGRWIAYFSDESGEYSLHLRAQSGQGDVRKISLGDSPTFFFSPLWSPDSKKIVYTDKRQAVWYVDLEKGTPVRIDSHVYGLFAPPLSPAWSPDSRWIAYSKQTENRLCAVFVYALETGKSHQLTDAMSDATNPVFDAKGELLYFFASTDSGPARVAGDLSAFSYQPTRSPYVMVLRKDVPSPLGAESDEEKVADEKKPDDAKPPVPGGAPAPTPASAAAGVPPAGPRPPAKEAPPVKIDFDGIGQRILALPIPARNFTSLLAGKAGAIFILEAVAPSTPPGPPGQVLHKYDLIERKLEKLQEGVLNVRISQNGEKLLFRRGPQWMIIPASTPPRPGSGNLNTATMETRVDPRAEWAQMYREAWRHERDFFYDPGLHGLDLDKARKFYEPYLAAVAHRSDLNYLFTEMLNQLTVSHMFVGGGDMPQPTPVPGGLLGADYAVENGRYRIKKIYDGENWNPQLRAPLTEPGVNVSVGDYILEVGGRDLLGTHNIYSFFESTSGKAVLLKISADPAGANSRQVTVVPVANETGLRNRAWIEGNRRKVDELSGGRLAYVYMPDTANGGYAAFNRYFFAQTNKEGAVIDERHNSGGLLAEYVVGYLKRPLLNYLAQRDGKDMTTPSGAIFGPKVMIINERAGSGGDAMPWYFRKWGVGPLVGKRTWGGLVGVGGTPQLMDGGGIAAPASALYGLNGEWEVENVGVPPDIDVELDPQAWRNGRDTQLEKAVEVALADLRKNPLSKHKRPAYPNYHRTGPLGKKP